MNIDWKLVEDVISEACENRDPVTMDAPFEAVIWQRFGATKGGVGHAQARTRAMLRAGIREFYAPRDWSPEPTGLGY